MTPPPMPTSPATYTIVLAATPAQIAFVAHGDVVDAVERFADDPAQCDVAPTEIGRRDDHSIAAPNETRNGDAGADDSAIADRTVRVAEQPGQIGRGGDGRGDIGLSSLGADPRRVDDRAGQVDHGDGQFVDADLDAERGDLRGVDGGRGRRASALPTARRPGFGHQPRAHELTDE